MLLDAKPNIPNIDFHNAKGGNVKEFYFGEKFDINSIHFSHFSVLCSVQTIGRGSKFRLKKNLNILCHSKFNKNRLT